MIRAKIIGTGAYAPKRILTNADLEKMVDTNDEWIQQRSGIRERHIARPEQSVAMLSHEASARALERAGLTAAEIDSIVLATATPDRLLPSTACDLQALLGADKAAWIGELVARREQGDAQTLAHLHGSVPDRCGERALIG